MLNSFCSRRCICKVIRFCCVGLKHLVCCVLLCPVRCVTAPCTACLSYRGRRLCVLYIITFCVILPRVFHNAKQSMFFPLHNRTALHSAMRLANSARVLAAERYLASLNRTSPPQQLVLEHSRSPSGAVSVALTVITVSRNRRQPGGYQPKYLTQTVAKFHWLLDRWRQQRHKHSVDIELSICNVDHDVASYHEAGQITQLVPTFSRFNHTHFSMVHPLEKEKEDYVFCLNKSLQLHAKAEYLLLVEDDAYPTDDVLLVLQHVLSTHLLQSYVRGEFRPSQSNVAFVKFYHPEWLLGFFSLAAERVPEYLSYSILLSSVLTALYAGVCGFTEGEGNVTVNELWTSLFKFSLLVLLACGRTGVSEWRRLASPHLYSWTPAPSCCTPAMLFSRHAAHLVVDYLDRRQCGNNLGKDSLIDRMLNDTGMMAYLIQPNCFTHIGFYSSLRERDVDPLMV